MTERQRWRRQGRTPSASTFTRLGFARALAKVVTYVGFLASQQLDLDQALEAGKQGLQLAVESGDVWAIAMAKVALAGTLRAAEDLGRVPALLAAARPAFETFLDHRGDWGVAGCQVLAARVAMSLEDGLAVTVQRSGDANGSEAMYRQVVAECPHIDSKSPHQLATHDFGGSPAADH